MPAVPAPPTPPPPPPVPLLSMELFEAPSDGAGAACSAGPAGNGGSTLLLVTSADGTTFERCLLSPKRSKPPDSANPRSAFLSSAFGPTRFIFSICWCCDRIANRFTCTGIGTTILFAVPVVPVPDPLALRLPRPCELRPALTRFHLARRFWNQILTYTRREMKIKLNDRTQKNAPSTYLHLAQLQAGRDLATFRKAEVLFGVKLSLQLQQLFRCEGGSATPGFGVFRTAARFACPPRGGRVLCAIVLGTGVRFTVTEICKKRVSNTLDLSLEINQFGNLLIVWKSQWSKITISCLSYFYLHQEDHFISIKKTSRGTVPKEGDDNGTYNFFVVFLQMFGWVPK